MVMLRHVVRHPKSYMIMTDPDGPQGTEEWDGVQCAHCGMHFRVVPGSGTKRGFCLNCNQITCGKQPCETTCLHWEKAIEQMEAAGRRALNTKAIERTRKL